jgi:hypothetical protein
LVEALPALFLDNVNGMVNRPGFPGGRFV